MHRALELPTGGVPDWELQAGRPDGTELRAVADRCVSTRGGMWRTELTVAGLV